MSGLSSILVSGIPSSAKRDQLEIHFQKRKYGGGDVSSLIYPLRETVNSDCAVITFEKQEVAENVLRTPQTFHGVHLGTRPLGKQVFRNLTVEIDHDMLMSIPGAKSTLEWQFGLRCEKQSDRSIFIAKGNWYQIEAARRFIEEKVGIDTPYRPDTPIASGSSSVDAESMSSKIWQQIDSHISGNPAQRNLPKKSADTVTVGQSGIGLRDLQAAAGLEEFSMARESKIRTGLFEAMMNVDTDEDNPSPKRPSVGNPVIPTTSDQKSHSDSPSEVLVDADVYQYLKLTKYDQLKELQVECKVDFKSDGGQPLTSLQIVPLNKYMTSAEIASAKERFIALYESIYQGLQKYDLHLPEAISEPEAMETAALDTQINVPNMYMKQEKRGHYSIYGTDRSIGKAKVYFYAKLADVMKANRSKAKTTGKDILDKMFEMTFIDDSDTSVRQPDADLVHAASSEPHVSKVAHDDDPVMVDNKETDKTVEPQMLEPEIGTRTPTDNCVLDTTDDGSEKEEPIEVKNQDEKDGEIDVKHSP